METIPTPYRSSLATPSSSSYIPSHAYPQSSTSLRTQSQHDPPSILSRSASPLAPRGFSSTPSYTALFSQPYPKSTLAVVPTSSSRDAMASSSPAPDMASSSPPRHPPSHLPFTYEPSSRSGPESQVGHFDSSDRQQESASCRVPPVSSSHPSASRRSEFSRERYPLRFSSSSYALPQYKASDQHPAQRASSPSTDCLSRNDIDDELAYQSLPYQDQPSSNWTDAREIVGGVAYPALVRKRRRRTSPEELSILESHFAKNPMPCHVEREAIGTELSMTARHVTIWFQNRRQIEKKRQTGDLAPSSQQFDLSSPNLGTFSLSQSSTYASHAQDEDEDRPDRRPSRSSSITESGSDTLYYEEEDDPSLPSLSFSSSSSGSLISALNSSQGVPPPPPPLPAVLPILEALVPCKSDADLTPRPQRRIGPTSSFESSTSNVSLDSVAGRSELPIFPSTPSTIHFSKPLTSSGSALTSQSVRSVKTPAGSGGRSMMDEIVQSKELPFAQGTSAHKRRRLSSVPEGGEEARKKTVGSRDSAKEEEDEGKDVWKAMMSDPLSSMDDLAPLAADEDGEEEKTDTDQPPTAPFVSSQGSNFSLSSSSHRLFSTIGAASRAPPISKVVKAPTQTPAKPAITPTSYTSLFAAFSPSSLLHPQPHTTPSQPTPSTSSATANVPGSSSRTIILSRLGSSSRRSASLDHVASRPPGSSSKSKPSTSITTTSSYNVSSRHSTASSQESNSNSNGSMSGRTTTSSSINMTQALEGGQKRTRVAVGKTGSMDMIVEGSSGGSRSRSSKPSGSKRAASQKQPDKKTTGRTSSSLSSAAAGKKSVVGGGKAASGSGKKKGTEPVVEVQKRWVRSGKKVDSLGRKINDGKVIVEEAKKDEEGSVGPPKKTVARPTKTKATLPSPPPVKAPTSAPVSTPATSSSASASTLPSPPSQPPKLPAGPDQDQECAMLLLGLLGGGP